MTTRSKALAGLSAVFLLGALCGALALGLFVRGEVRDRDRLKDPEGFHDYFSDRLSLTRAQRDSLQEELDRAYGQMADIRYQVDQEYRQVFDTLAGRMAPVLNEKQRQMLARQRSELLTENIDVEGAEPSPISLDEIDRRAAAAPLAARQRPVDSAAVSTESTKSEPTHDTQSPDEPTDVAEESPEPIAGDGMLSPDAGEDELPGILKRMKRQLSLDDAQTAEVRDILVKAVRRNLWIRKNLEDRPRLATRRLRQSFRLLDRQLAAVLTVDQFRIYREIKADRRQKRMERRPSE